MPTIDVLNAWKLDATAFGNHEFDYGPARILKQQARSNFDWLSSNIVETATGRAAVVREAVGGLSASTASGSA